MSSGGDFGTSLNNFSESFKQGKKKAYQKLKFRHIPEIVMNTGELDLVNKEIAEDYVEHIPMPPGLAPGREGFKQFVQMLRTAFPDLHYEVDHMTTSDLIGENQKVMHRITAIATHTGPWGPIPATGRHMTWTEIHIGLYVHDMMVEHWGNVDTLGIMQQMGVIPGWQDKPPVPPTPHPGGRTTSHQENSLMVQRYVREMWNKGNLEVADELVHPLGVSASLPALPVGPQGVKINVRMHRQAFRNLYLLIEDMLAEENAVAIRFKMIGNHQGIFMGIPATGKDIEVDGCCIFHFEGGQIVEHWQEADHMGLLGQLGVAG